MTDPDAPLDTLSEQDYGIYLLASSFRHIPDPSTGVRGQLITFWDSWYPTTKQLLDTLRRAGNPGVAMFDREVKDGWHD